MDMDRWLDSPFFKTLEICKKAKENQRKNELFLHERKNERIVKKFELERERVHF